MLAWRFLLNPALTAPRRGSGLGSHRQFLFLGFRTIFQNVGGLAFEMGANGFERGETDGPGLASFEDGKILRRDVHGFRQIVQPHFALGERL